jgi:hypothetical protein
MTMSGRGVHSLNVQAWGFPPILAFPKTKVDRETRPVDPADSRRRVRFLKICSQFEILEIANFDGKPGKMPIALGWIWGDDYTQA